jgi:tRNA A-37 threonylcarbamoyl transferase component Bud32
MVIMDALDEEYKTFDKNALPATKRENIEAGLTKLHQAHYVHGDVRDVNIMVRQDGKPGFMLVDFDWAGIIGEVFYPANVNKKDVERPDDVSDGAPIKSEHDMAMLEYMFR